MSEIRQRSRPAPGTQAAEPDEARFVAPSFVLATMMTATAGFVDAIGYAYVGKLYLSFMSGNSTRLGMALAGLDWDVVRAASALVATFICGAFAGTLLADIAGRRRLPAVLGVETALLALAAALTHGGYGFVSLLPVTAAMGMQNAIHQIVAGADIGKTFITGALYGVGQALAEAVRGKAPRVEWVAYATSWGIFVTGVVTGSLVLGRFGLVAALTGLTVLLAGLTARTLLHRETRS